MLLCVILLWPSKSKNSLILMQICLEFEILGKIVWKSYFWEIWVQYKCFWKTFHLILMHFIHKILCFEVFLHKIALFFKNLFFLDFWSIEPVSRLIEIAIKSLVWLCVFQSMLNWFWINRRHFRSIKPIFSINQKSYREFLKPLFPHVFFPIQTFFKTRSLSIRSV